MEIYVIIGHTGEYSDHTSWTVAAYTDKNEAKKHMRLAFNRAKEIFNARDDVHYCDNDEDNEYDPHMLMDYTRTFYTIETIELFDEVLEFKLHR